jgi:hypothetical protein
MARKLAVYIIPNLLITTSMVQAGGEGGGATERGVPSATLPFSPTATN